MFSLSFSFISEGMMASWGSVEVKSVNQSEVVVLLILIISMRQFYRHFEIKNQTTFDHLLTGLANVHAEPKYRWLLLIDRWTTVDIYAFHTL